MKKIMLYVLIVILVIGIGVFITIGNNGGMIYNSTVQIVSQEEIDVDKDIKKLLPSSYTEKQHSILQLDDNEYYRIRYLSDGLEVVGFIVKPKGEGKYPIIIYNRGGNREYGKIKAKDLAYFSYLSSQGYVVLASQYRGNDGSEGQEEFGGEDVNDVLNLINVAKTLPYTRKDEIFMLGHSRGGMMTYLAIKYGADIKAAAVIGGVSDTIASYNERGYAMKKVFVELIGGTPDEYPEEYKKRSAFYWPEKINKPILILHGEKDTRTNVISQAQKLVDEFEEIGKTDYKFVIYPEGNHGLSDYFDEVHSEVFKWFDKYGNYSKYVR